MYCFFGFLLFFVCLLSFQQFSGISQGFCCVSRGWWTAIEGGQLLREGQSRRGQPLKGGQPSWGVAAVEGEKPGREAKPVLASHRRGSLGGVGWVGERCGVFLGLVSVKVLEAFLDVWRRRGSRESDDAR
jgi:hypothetical protein